MKVLCLFVLLNGLFVQTLSSQTLIQQIEEAYRKLDSLSYIENVILSFEKELEKQEYESNNTTLELYGFDYHSLDSIQRRHTLDSIDAIHRKSIHYQKLKNLSIEEQINQFAHRVRSKTPLFVLNLVVKDKLSIELDTGQLSFDLYYFAKYMTKIEISQYRC